MVILVRIQRFKIFRLLPKIPHQIATAASKPWSSVNSAGHFVITTAWAKVNCALHVSYDEQADR